MPITAAVGRNLKKEGGVRGVKFEKWQIPTVSTEAVRRLTEAGYPYLVSAVLVSRGITTAADAAAFLAQEHSLIYDPRLMRDMDRAVGRISRALADGERMAVFGDYDVDGITSTVLLLDYLKNCGAKCLRYIPGGSRTAPAFPKTPSRACGTRASP